MCNYAIGVATAEKPKSRFELVRLALVQGEQSEDREDDKRGQSNHGELYKSGRCEKNRTTKRVHMNIKSIVDHGMTHGLGSGWSRSRESGSSTEEVTDKESPSEGNEHLGLRRGPDADSVKDGTVRHARLLRQLRGTPRYCQDCGSRVAPMQERKVFCSKCDSVWDRDVLASRNMMACAVPQIRPRWGYGGGERGDDGSNPKG